MSPTSNISYINTIFRYNSKKASDLVECLLSIYTTHLLPTFNIVHTQYIIFYLANLDPGIPYSYYFLIYAN